MNILVIGSGGREHAICRTFLKSPRVAKIFCAPGNAGISSIAECVHIEADDIGSLAEFASVHAIDLTFVGGESPLAGGIVDRFQDCGLRILGPTRAAARLESSKAFAKEFMERHSIPTARFATASSTNEAAGLLETGRFGNEDSPVVIKADGLAAGKGVVVARDRKEALDAIYGLAGVAGKDAAQTIVIEECLFGREVSLLLFVDGKDLALMPPSRDHKRIGAGDRGPNTGGMGTITDEALLTPTQLQEVLERIVRPTLLGCISEGFPFRGILFLGLMITEDGPKVLEYNVRFGDPETQSILVRLETDLVEICEAMLEGRLSEIEIEWLPGSSATVVLAAAGYPGSPRKGDVIRGIENAAMVEGVTVFHAGTSLAAEGRATGSTAENAFGMGDYVTSGGRVLGVTAVGETLLEALDRAYSAVEMISWEGMQYRCDIGK